VTKISPKAPVMTRLPGSAPSLLDDLPAAHQPMMKLPAKASALHQSPPLPGINVAREAREREGHQEYHTRMSAQAKKTRRILMPTSSWKESGSWQ
jgi:hypothetical protein